MAEVVEVRAGFDIGAKLRIVEGVVRAVDVRENRSAGKVALGESVELATGVKYLARHTCWGAVYAVLDQNAIEDVELAVTVKLLVVGCNLAAVHGNFKGVAKVQPNAGAIFNNRSEEHT